MRHETKRRHARQLHTQTQPATPAPASTTRHDTKGDMNHCSICALSPLHNPTDPATRPTPRTNDSAHDTTRHRTLACLSVFFCLVADDCVASASASDTMYSTAHRSDTSTNTTGTAHTTGTSSASGSARVLEFALLCFFFVLVLVLVY